MVDIGKARQVNYRHLCRRGFESTSVNQRSYALIHYIAGVTNYEGQLTLWGRCDVCGD